MISKKLSIVHCQLSIILAFLPLSVAYAQQDSTLNRTVVVENEYNPNIMDASKINVLPRVEEPAVMKKGIEYATALRPVSAWTYESMSPITREWAMNRAKRGYVRAGYGNYGNVDFKAGYLWDITGNINTFQISDEIFVDAIDDDVLFSYFCHVYHLTTNL